MQFRVAVVVKHCAKGERETRALECFSVPVAYRPRPNSGDRARDQFRVAEAASPSGEIATDESGWCGEDDDDENSLP